MTDIAHVLVRFDSDGHPIAGYLAHPADGKTHPGVVIAPGPRGITTRMQDLTRRIARTGFTVLLVDIHSRRGVPRGLDGEAALARLAESLPDTTVVGDLRAAASHLAGDPRVRPGRLGLVGFATGGAHALLAGAGDARIGAIVDCYGRICDATPCAARPRAPIDAVKDLHAPLLGVFCGADPSIPATDIERLRGVLMARDIPHRIVVVPDAAPGFLEADPTQALPVIASTFELLAAFLHEHLDAG